MDCDQNVIFLLYNFLFYNLYGVLYCFLFLYFATYAYYVHTASLWYCTIMSGRILEVSMTLTLKDKHAFTYFLMLSVDFEI